MRCSLDERNRTDLNRKQKSLKIWMGGTIELAWDGIVMVWFSGLATEKSLGLRGFIWMDIPRYAFEMIWHYQMNIPLY